MTLGREGEIAILRETDIVAARRAIRDAAMQLGFPPTEVTRIVTAVSELARNICKYASTGKMQWRPIESNGRAGIDVIFVDHGPGIKDIQLAMQEGYSTGGGLGMGLPGAKRLVDEMQISSVVGEGTTVRLKKWRRM